MAVAKGNIKTTLVLAGEAAYTATMNKLRRQQQALRAEGRALASTYNDETKAQEKLIDKSKLLERQIKTQQQMCAKLHNEMEDTAKATGENSEETKKAEMQYNNAVATLNNLEKQLNAVNQELKESNSKWLAAGKSASQYGDMLTNAGDKLESAGKKLSIVSGATAALGYTAIDAAIDYESAFTGVRKTVDATDEQFASLYNSILDLSTEIPATAEEIAGIAEVAGQLGIKTNDLMNFTEVMVNLGESTNLSAEEAASALAKFANITGMSADDYERLGSVIVDLGNNFATTEADIVNMAMRLASTGEITGLSQSQMMAVATALNSVGIEAEAGGSAFSKLLKKVQLAVETGSSDLSKFASVSNMSVSEFKELWGKDAVAAIGAFTEGLNDTERNGKSAVAVLDDLDIKEVRMSNTILALSGASGLLTDTVNTANKAWDENTALQKEAATRYETLESKIQIVKNELHNVAITFGEDLMPYVEKGTEKIKDLAKWFGNLDESQRKTVIRFAAMVTGAGPLLLVLGKLTSGVGAAATTAGKFISVIGKMKLDDSTKGVTSLAKAILEVNGATGNTAQQASSMVSAFGAGSAWCIAIIGATALIAGLYAAYRSLAYGSKETQDTINAIGDGISDFKEKVELADGSIENIKQSLDFSDKDAELQQQYDEIQQKIVDIASVASDERRELTDTEKQELADLFEQLNLITEQQAELFRETQDKVKTLVEAENNLTDEQAANYIAKAQTACEAAKQAAVDTAAQKILALEQTMSKEDEAYQQNVDRINAERDAEIAAANNSLSATIDIITQKELATAGGYESFKQRFIDYNNEMFEAENSFNETSLANNQTANDTALANSLNFFMEKKKINDEFSSDFLETNQETVSAYLATVQQTIDSGGQLSDEQISMCLEILRAYETLPNGSKKAFGDTIESIRTEINSYDLKTEGTNAGKDFGEGVKIGLNDKKADVGNASRGLGDWLKKTFNISIGRKSPAKEGIAAGRDWDRGVALGLKNNSDLVEKEAVNLAETLMTASTPKSPKISLQPSLDALERSYYGALETTASMQKAYYSNTYINNNSQYSAVNNYNSASDSRRLENSINDFKNELCSMLKSEFKKSDGIMTERQAGRIINKCLKSVNM